VSFAWRERAGLLVGAALLSGVVALCACGGSGSARSEVIPIDKVKSCAGFTVEKAALILGIAARDLKDDGRALYDTPERTAHVCSYMNQSWQTSQTSVSFGLTRESSIEAEKDAFQSLRRNLAIANKAIGDVTGSTEKGPDTEPLAGLGDEAFYASANGALSVRVANVLLQVMVPPDLELKKKVAQEVVAGLR